jgi:hypothetical protein
MAGGIAKDINNTTLKLQKLAQCELFNDLVWFGCDWLVGRLGRFGRGDGWRVTHGRDTALDQLQRGLEAVTASEGT